MQARYYDPVIGRFYSNDPVGFLEHYMLNGHIQGFNRYSYVRNNPYKYTDPTGKFDVQVQSLGYTNYDLNMADISRDNANDPNLASKTFNEVSNGTLAIGILATLAGHPEIAVAMLSTSTASSVASAATGDSPQKALALEGVLAMTKLKTADNIASTVKNVMQESESKAVKENVIDATNEAASYTASEELKAGCKDANTC